MAQDIVIGGATFGDVPRVDIPRSDGGTASFVDTSDDTVSADKLLQGVTAHDASGESIVGTAVLGQPYTRLRSIILDGASWFDLGIYPEWDWEFTMEYIASVTSAAQYLFGTRTTTSASQADTNTLMMTSSNFIRRDYYGSSKTGTTAETTKTSVRSVYVYRHLARIAADTGSISATATSVSSGVSAYPLWLGAGNTAGEPTSPFSGNLMRFGIYVNHVLTHDYIPVLDSNGIPCMYDMVDDEYFYNAGTGTLSYEEFTTPMLLSMPMPIKYPENEPDNDSFNSFDGGDTDE